MNLNVSTRGVAHVLANNVAPGGTFTVGYPSDVPRSYFVNPGPHGFLYVAGTSYPVSGGKVSFSYGASSVTVTWNGDRTLEAGEEVVVGLPINREVKNLFSIENVSKTGANALYLVRYSVAIPAAADTDAIAASQTPSAAGDLTLTDDPVELDYARTVTITSAGNLSSLTFTIYGKDIAGRDQVAQVTGPNISTVETACAFKSVSRVAVSGAAGAAVTVGFGNKFGLPCFLAMSPFQFRAIRGSTEISATWTAGNGGTVSATSTDPQGLVSPATAPDGATDYEFLFLASDINALGNVYSG